VDVITEHGSASLRVHTGHCVITPILETDGKITFSVKIEAKMQFGELHGFENMSVAEIIPELEKGAADTITALVDACFKKTQTINADIYGFGAAIHRSFPGEWKKLKDQWDTLYPEVSLSVGVRTSLVATGEISGSLEMKEANADANG